MSAFLIEKGVPVPACRRIGGCTHKYPFEHMEVGDSFFVASSRPRCRRVSDTRLGTTVWRFSKKHPEFKFTCQSVGPEEGEKEEGVRVWRVAKEDEK